MRTLSAEAYAEVLEEREKRLVRLLRRLGRYVLTRACKECPFCEMEHDDTTEDIDGNEVQAQHAEACALRALLAEIDGAE